MCFITTSDLTKSRDTNQRLEDILGPVIFVLNKEVSSFQRFTKLIVQVGARNLVLFIKALFFLYCVLNTESPLLEVPLQYTWHGYDVHAVR